MDASFENRDSKEDDNVHENIEIEDEKFKFDR